MWCILMRTHTCILVLGFVHLAVSAFSNDADDVKLVHTALSPVALGLHSFTVPRTAEPAQTAPQHGLNGF